MLRRILLATLLLSQAFTVASVLQYDPIPICFPCPDGVR